MPPSAPIPKRHRLNVIRQPISADPSMLDYNGIENRNPNVTVNVSKGDNLNSLNGWKLHWNGDLQYVKPGSVLGASNAANQAVAPLEESDSSEVSSDISEHDTAPVANVKGKKVRFADPKPEKLQEDEIDLFAHLMRNRSNTMITPCSCVFPSLGTCDHPEIGCCRPGDRFRTHLKRGDKVPYNIVVGKERGAAYIEYCHVGELDYLRRLVLNDEATKWN